MPNHKIRTFGLAIVVAALGSTVIGLPTAHPSSSVVPGQSPLYSNYSGEAPPFPGNIRGATLPSSPGEPAPDDVLWQNLLAAEWVVFSFYQQAVTEFNQTSFTSLGLPNTTYERIIEIRDNEAGHLNAFYNVGQETTNVVALGWKSMLT